MFRKLFQKTIKEAAELDEKVNSCEVEEGAAVENVEKEKKGVLAVVTDEEFKEIESLSTKDAACQKAMEDIIGLRSEIIEEKKQFWKKLNAKYNLSDNRLVLNRETKEITKAE